MTVAWLTSIHASVQKTGFSTSLSLPLPFAAILLLTCSTSATSMSDHTEAVVYAHLEGQHTLALAALSKLAEPAVVTCISSAHTVYTHHTGCMY